MNPVAIHTAWQSSNAVLGAEIKHRCTNQKSEFKNVGPIRVQLAMAASSLEDSQLFLDQLKHPAIGGTWLGKFQRPIVILVVNEL
jgi:hypothetical protein